MLFQIKHCGVLGFYPVIITFLYHISLPTVLISIIHQLTSIEQAYDKSIYFRWIAYSNPRDKGITGIKQ